MKVLEGDLQGQGLRFCVIVSRFNDFLTMRLLDGCIDALVRHGVDKETIVIAKTPGAFELPLVAKKAAAGRAYDAVIALGAIIRGATPHFEYVASECTKGLAQASMETGVPVAYGVITADTIEQAIERAGTKSGNKGWDAAMTAIEMANLIKHIEVRTDDKKAG
ncbi:6,7-dimethyl-8-ribityllumazine synthase [Candidatus Magnetobacterium bavaricum]|uniref:6,7-dimethyl-8-ribityllumazine synthase n=1 Tax=Candidatus Magnetobacterium bavaricum TaxID=29290 RepID=A0A0F3GKG4_9BACT|nr:6,7-dimethyl-8-ribityllumazine synthase [Candidatus Magnetobacterium bavaricum]